MSRNRSSTPASHERLTASLRSLADEIRAGHLDARADLADATETEAEALRLVNQMVDDLVRPLRLAATSLEQIACGSIPEFILDDHAGEFGHIKRNINIFLATLHGMSQEVRNLVDSVKEGRLRVRGNDWDFKGVWSSMIRGINDVVDAFQHPFDVTTACIRGISAGAIPPPITESFRGEYRRIARDLNQLIGNIATITQAVLALSRAAVDGRLDERAQSDVFAGDWRSLIEGVNATLDAALAPVKEAGAVLERVSRYDLEAKMEGEYAGDHARIKDALNLTIETLNRALIQVSSSASHLESSGRSIAGAARAVYEGAAQQTAAVDEIGERLLALTRQSHENAASTGDALSVSSRVCDAARAGKEGADRVVVVMNEIHEAARASTSVIQEINDVAARTGSLSSKAAAEANRVATSGRGFTVVAEEVRKLAKQSREVTLEMETLFRRIVAALKAGGVELDVVDSRSLTARMQQMQEIAFQTNMLSLNAAVEAAHVAAASAGIEGVNAEVRKLATEAKHAAERTATLTQQSLKAAAHGTTVARSVEVDLASTVAGVTKMASLVDAIAESSRAQLSSADAVVETMKGIASVSRSSADNAQVSADAAASLANETSALSSMVGRFRLADEHTPS